MKKNVNSKKILLILVMLLGFITNSFAQKNPAYNDEMIPLNRNEDGSFMSENEMFKNNLKKIQGTFQIQISKADYTVPISESLYDKIQSSRKENEDVILFLDENSNLFLPSKNKINAIGFKKLEPIKVVIK
ncbi:hypothetical protein SAMN05444005_1162 [Flavobacterium urocaniciphilum]|uniref:Uncharacterized protein n=1 Tax=Flavobacterium urocaniciphilum TaxID=1299341 RepID=A0A1H9EB79_9FLAO|nr:hypothetical protein SAMN05444005_1162 [Flavobacterium urocaniciphilum]